MNVSSEAEVPQPAPRAVPPAFLALVAPDTGMERQARVGKTGLAVAIAIACSLFSAFAQSSRVDARSATLQKLEKGGQLATMSDRQIEDDTHSAERLFEVKTVAWGVVSAPVFLLLQALAVVVLVWFLGGKLKGRSVFPVAAAVLLPSAIAAILDGVTALRMQALPSDAVALAPRGVAGIMAAFGHPLTGAALKLGGALDFFSLWAAALMAFGLAAAVLLPSAIANVLDGVTALRMHSL
ncbi:MAG TPA: hypothetical protein VFP52_06095, partial [Myxococcales bacterium]|nr:hypothetical protein [Myxococcales bacterium]